METVAGIWLLKTHNPLESMRSLLPFLFSAASLPVALWAAEPSALTIYNNNFAVVREHVALDLPAGASQVDFPGVTTSLEPDSVILRDPAGKIELRVLEQSYRAETASEGLLLALNEGKTIDFILKGQGGAEFTIPGKIVRSGWNPGGGRTTPIIEVDGKLRFSLPGEPVFSALGGDTILQPTLSWQLYTAQPAKVNAEVSYLTGGLSWAAAYNFVLPEKGDQMEVVGWVTLNNQSGKRFEDAAVKLLAGDVNKLAPAMAKSQRGGADGVMMLEAFSVAAVTEKAFDEFHLYTLPRPVTLRDQETKQVEFVRGSGIPVKTLYVYDGAQLMNYRGWQGEMLQTNADYGTQSDTHVAVVREFKNTKEAGLGMPLPAGRARFYRRDDADNRLEFTGENQIKHTPQGETVRLYTGDAFDLVGERKRTAFTYDKRSNSAEESFEIKVRNRKTEAATVTVVEHLSRGVNWKVTARSMAFTQTNARDIEFTVKLAPDEETVITYTVRYDYR